MYLKIFEIFHFHIKSTHKVYWGSVYFEEILAVFSGLMYGDISRDHSHQKTTTFWTLFSVMVVLILLDMVLVMALMASSGWSIAVLTHATVVLAQLNKQTHCIEAGCHNLRKARPNAKC